MHQTNNRTRLVQTATLLALGMLTLAPASVSADWMFTTGEVNAGKSGNVSAEAYFVVGNGTITVYVANLESTISNQGQAISGISFTVSSPPNTSLSLTSVTGNDGSLSNGTISSTTNQTFTASGTLPTAANWAATSVNNVTDLGSSNPTYMIVGPNVQFNGGGGANFNPYFQSTATAAFNTAPTATQIANGFAVEFVLSAPGASPNSTISNVQINFGTSTNEFTANGSGGSISTPAPSSAVLVGVGGFCLVGFMLRSRRRLTASA